MIHVEVEEIVIEHNQQATRNQYQIKVLLLETHDVLPLSAQY